MEKRNDKADSSILSEVQKYEGDMHFSLIHPCRKIEKDDASSPHTNYIYKEHVDHSSNYAKKCGDRRR